MAYNAIAQNEHDALSDDALSNMSGSPPPLQSKELSFQPLSLDFTDLGGSLFINDGTKPVQQERPHPTAPSAATSYDMLEDDDYEIPEMNPSNKKTDIDTSQRHATASSVPQHILNADRPPLPPPHKNSGELSTNKKMTWQNDDEPIIIPRTTSPEPMMRTASSEGSVDLRHPAPDLQSLQGAYVGNVERLERSAERLSMTLNISAELEKLKQEQKRSESRRSSMRASLHGDGTSPGPIARKFSTNSGANSIIDINSAARSGGYSPGGYFSPHCGSIRSGSFTQPAGLRMVQRSSSHDQEQGERQIHSIAPTSVPIIAAPVPRRNSRDLLAGKDTLPEKAIDTQPGLEIPADVNRPTTSASVDTIQQTNQLFTDFDGVHFAPTLQDPSGLGSGQYGTRRISSNNTAVGRQSYGNALNTDSGMVYYPAPVPVMLNLPKKISKLPSAAREQRRSQMLDSIPPSIKLSTNWLPGVEEVSASAEELSLEDRRQSKPLAANRRSAATALNMPTNLPPQLRASVFFNQPGVGQDVEVQGDSAVATLDSILNASAHAPVGAFTDHPIVGRVGAEVYGREHTKKPINSSFQVMAGNLKKKGSRDELRHTRRSGSRASLGFLLKRRQGEDGESDDDANEDKANDEQQLSPAEEERLSQYDEDAEGTEEDDDFHAEAGPYMGAPTTLLAELQMRKQEQRMRNRSAANAFPNGMHSTLLELDAVAQVQKNSRRNKRVALAWEDPDAHGPGSDDEDDDDVPLAIIYANKLNQRDEDRPLGLMEKRELEDNEPLSKRRERLRGGPAVPRNLSPHKRASTMFQLEIPHFTEANNGEDSGEDEEEETLAQRLKRIKAKGTATGLNSDVGSEFANDLLGKFGAEKDAALKKNSDPKAAGRESPEEETLGQRRRRLQAEREAKAKEASTAERPGLNKRRSMADILQAHPAARSGLVSNEPSRAPAVGGLLYQEQLQQEQRAQQLREQNMYSVHGVPDGPLLKVEQEHPAPPLGGLLYQHQHQQQYPSAFAGGLYNNGGLGAVTPGYGGYGGGMGMNGYGNQATFNALSQMNGFASAPAVSAAAGGYAGGINGQGTMMMQQMVALDAKQRDMVERWRQSIMQ